MQEILQTKLGVKADPIPPTKRREDKEKIKKAEETAEQKAARIKKEREAKIKKAKERYLQRKQETNETD